MIGKKLIDGFTEETVEFKALPAGTVAGVDTLAQKETKKENWEKLLVVLFLRNLEHGRYGELLVDYRKSYANKDCRYPDNVPDMIDVMRQQPEKKKPKSPRNNKNNNGDKEKNSDEFASSFAQKRKQEEECEIVCYCCGNKD